MSKFIACYNKIQQPLNENKDPYSLQCGVHNVQQKMTQMMKLAANAFKTANSSMFKNVKGNMGTVDKQETLA